MRGPSRLTLVWMVCGLIAGSMILPAEAAAKGKPIPIPEELRTRVRGAEPAAGCAVQQWDNDAAAFAWVIPDTYGDTMVFVRFTPTFNCTLTTVQFWLADASLGAAGTPDAIVDIYSATGPYPDSLLASDTLLNSSFVYFPAGPNVVDFSALNLELDRDFCVVIRRGGSDLDTLAFISDDGSLNSARSGWYCDTSSVNSVCVYVDGGWELMSEAFVDDYNWFIRLELCCGDAPGCTPSPQPDWPTYGGSFQRTMRSNTSVTNECQLTLDWITQGVSSGSFNRSAWTNVVVSDTLAFLSFHDYLMCFDARTGDTLWTTPRSQFPAFGEDMRCNVTVDDSVLYFGGGAFNSINCLRVADGSVVWTYGPGTTIPPTAPAPQGRTRFCPTVIKDSLVFFAPETFNDATPPGEGEVFALNKYSGSLYTGWPVNPRPLAEGGVYNGLTSDGDSLLFAGTVGNASALTNGRLYAIRISDGTIKWELEDPSAIYLDPNLQEEGFSGFLSYENGILYYQSNIDWGAPTYPHFPWDGSVGAIDVNAEDGTGAGIIWVAAQPVGRCDYGGPVLGEGMVYVNCAGLFIDPNPRGVLALNKATGNRVWLNRLDDIGISMPLMLTCEPGGNPYIFAGSYPGYWYLLDGFTGDVIWTRTFSGVVHGTAVTDSQVLVSTRNSLTGTGTGQLASFRITGVNRPRMEVLQQETVQTNALPGSGNTTRDTIYSALSNVGCADLSITSFGVDTSSPVRRIVGEHPALASWAGRLADRMASRYLDFDFGFTRGMSVSQLKRGNLRDVRRQYIETGEPYHQRWTRSRITAAGPLVLTVENTTPMNVASGDSVDIALLLNETGQIPRTSTINYVELNTNDPDFFPEDTSYSIFGSPVIPVEVNFGYAFERDTFPSMDAHTSVTNHGSMGGTGTDSAFWVEPDASATLYDGTFLIAGQATDSPLVAWDVYDWEYFQANDFLNIVRDTALGTTDGTNTLLGSIASSRYIDSIYFPDSTTTFSFGVEVQETQVAFNLPGTGGTSFKLVQACVINRNATAIDSPLVLGHFDDWDIASGANNVDTAFATSWNTVYMYDPGASSVYGATKLPRPGTPFEHPGGSVDTGDGLWSVYAVFNPDEVYPPTSTDSLIYDMVAPPGYNSLGGFERSGDAPGDMSMVMGFSQVQLGANETTYVHYALFGASQVGSFGDAALDAATGANVMAGFARGDVNADGSYNFLDLVYLYDWINGGSLRPIPRDEQGDVNGDDVVDQADVDYLEDFLYGNGPAPIGKWWW